MDHVEYINERGVELLAVKIIEFAIRDWKICKAGQQRYNLVEFFCGPWCEFLYTSITDLPIECMWEELGV